LSEAPSEPCNDAYRESPVNLLDAGQAPHRELRMAAEQGLRMNNIPLTNAVTMNSVAYATTEGGTSCHQATLALSSEAPIDVWPQRVSIQVTPLGSLFALGPSRDKREYVYLSNVSNELRLLAPRFPLEPAGVGAVWEMKRAHRTRGLGGRGGTETFRYELVELSDNRLVIAVQFARHEPGSGKPRSKGQPKEASTYGHTFSPTPEEEPERYLPERLLNDDYTLMLDLVRQPIPTRSMVRSQRHSR
jgi:hypothetical protein